MPRRQHPPLMPVPHLRVDLRRRYRSMTQESLDVADVHSFFQEEGRQGVPQHVGSHLTLQPRPLGAAAEHGADGLLGEAAFQAVVEEVAVVLRLGLPERAVVPEGGQGLFVAELEDSLPAPLAQDADAAAAQVHVLVQEVADLGHPGAGREEDLQHGDVPHQGAVGVGVAVGLVALLAVEVLEEALQVGQGDGPRQTAGLLDPHLHLAEGVDGDGVLPFQEVEEGLENRHLALDALLLERAEEALDVGAQGRLVHGREIGDLQVRRQVLLELPQVDGVRLQRLGAQVLLVAAVEQELRDGFL